jgi:hypothetical protein
MKSFIVLVVVIFMITGLSFSILSNNGITLQPTKIAHIGGNSVNSSSLTFGSTMITTGLWNLESAYGNSSIYVYSNSTINILGNFTNVVEKLSMAGVTSYPSVQFSHNILIPVEKFETNYFSYVSFDFVKLNWGIFHDCAYDLWFTNNKTTMNPTAEMMIWLDWSTPPGGETSPLDSFNMMTLVNGVEENVTWNLYFSGQINEHNYNTYIFAPSIPVSNQMSYKLSLSEFVVKLQSLAGINLNQSYVKSIDIGTEFGTGIVNNEVYDVWLNTYIIENGIKVPIVQGWYL